MVSTDRHTDRQTDRRHAKNDSLEISMPQKVYFHRNLDIDFSDQCNTFSILRIVEKVKRERECVIVFILLWREREGGKMLKVN